MEIRDIADVRTRIRRDAIAALAEDPHADIAYDHAILADILADADPVHWVPLWSDLRERVQWRDAVIDGADLGGEDRTLVLEDVENDIAALLTKMATNPAPAVPLRRAA